MVGLFGWPQLVSCTPHQQHSVQTLKHVWLRAMALKDRLSLQRGIFLRDVIVFHVQQLCSPRGPGPPTTPRRLCSPRGSLTCAVGVPQEPVSSILLNILHNLLSQLVKAALPSIPSLPLPSLLLSLSFSPSLQGADSDPERDYSRARGEGCAWKHPVL